MSKPQNYINHIAFVVDASSSMTGLADSVIKVFDKQIEHLSVRSQELDQETRVSVYMFGNDVECIIYDKDVMRLPSLRGMYRPCGMTALIDGTMTSIEELEQTAQLHGDHSFLAYVLTDGMENASNRRSSDLATKLKRLPDNWTVAVLVPDVHGVHESKKVGFTKDNIMQWDTSKEGIREVGERIKKVTENYMVGRSKGIRGTKSLFNLDLSDLQSRKISDNLEPLSSNEYNLYNVKVNTAIRPFVESQNREYKTGFTYYQLTKSEEIQPYKQIAVQNKISGRVYIGDKARQLLNLPNETIKVKPQNTGNFNIFVQSTSVNRKLIAGTKALVLNNT